MRAELVRQKRGLVALTELLRDDAAGVASSVLAVLLALSADRGAYSCLLTCGALQGTLDLLERALLKPEGTAEADEQQVRALQILRNLVRHDGSLLALFKDHPAVMGVRWGGASAGRQKLALSPQQGRRASAVR